MKSTILLILPIAAFILLMSSGCTVIGYGLGSAIDAGKRPNYRPTQPEERFMLSEGDELHVTEKGQRTRAVTFLRLVLPEEKDLLASVIDREQQTESTSVIRAGSRILLEEPGKASYECVFLGATTTEVWYRMPNDSQIRKCLFTAVRQVRSGELVVDAHFLKSVVSGHLESVYDMEVTDTGNARKIPLRNIEWLSVPEPSTAHRSRMTTVGVIADVLVIAAVMSIDTSGDGGGFGKLFNIFGAL